MTLKLGLEVEFFGFHKGKLINAQANGLPADSFPLLVEARGQPYDCAFQAVASVRGEIGRIKSLMSHKDIEPRFTDWLKKDASMAQLIQDAQRGGGYNKQIAWRNLWGSSPSDLNDTHVSAGLHVTFSNPIKSHVVSGNKTIGYEYNGMFDFIRVFRCIEKEFIKDIKKSKRTPGFYELKYDGKIEYRSLPATIINESNFDARLALAISKGLALTD